MDNRIIIILAILIAFGLFAVFTFATTSFIELKNNNIAFVNNEEWFNTAPFALNITTNSTGTAYNVSIYVNGTFKTWLYNSTTSVYSAWNNSVLSWSPVGDNSPVMEIQIAVNDSADTYNWTNSTYFFKINERASDTVNLTYDYDYIINGTEYFSSTLDLNMTLNETLSGCTAYLDDGKQSVTLANDTGVRTRYANSSAVSILSNGQDTWRSVVYRCNDAYNNYSWSNNSNSMGTKLLYKINEKGTNKVSVTPTSNAPVNNTIYNSATVFVYNLTLNETLTTCYAIVDNAVNSSLTNKSGVRTSFWNASVPTLDETTSYGDWRRITYRCEDTYGNYSWYNVSTTEPIYIKLDYTAPTLSFTDRKLNNYTVSGEYGNYVNLSYSITDANPSNNYITIYYPNNTKVNKTATTLQTGQVTNVTINITANDMPINGKYQFEIHAIDAVGRAATSGVANYTYVSNKIYANKFTPITMFGNYTIKAISSLIPYVTYISIWNDTSKGFINYAVGLVTNENVSVNSTLNVTWIKTNQDVTFSREFSTIHQNNNITLDTTGTATGTRWTPIGVVVEKTLNQTLYSTAFINASTNSVSSVNITVIAWKNDTSGLMCSAQRGFSITSCPGFTVNTITPKIGEMIWIMIHNNTKLEVNRTLI